MANARMRPGTNDSAAVVTAAMRRLRAAASVASLRGLAALLEQPDDVRAHRARTRVPASVGRMPRPARSKRSQPSSRASDATAADTDGCVTTRSSAAAVTEPPRTTARNAVSCVRVIAI